MPDDTQADRFAFIGHALRADGPFRPRVVSRDSNGGVSLVTASALVRYPREGAEKYARRNELAFYASPLAQACARFVGHLSARSPTRDLGNPLFERIADDTDGRGNAIDVFMAAFAYQAKARGSMLLQIDMPQTTGRTMAEQLATRRLPFWSVIDPARVTDFIVGDDGKFEFVEYAGNFTALDGERTECTWHFDRAGWWARDKEKKPLGEGAYSLGECPVLIFTEGSDFPSFGSFSAIADLGRRIFNLDSELDEILRSQTFSLLTMQVSAESNDAQKLDAARVAGETIGTNNLMVHSGSTPAFIAPPDGPARIYIDRINQLRDQIDEIGLNVVGSQERESGIALQMRFQALNGELASFASRMEDLERRAWDLSRRWLGLSTAPEIQWSRDFTLADVEQELKILHDMQGAAMPDAVIAEQQRRVVSVQFAGLDPERQQEIMEAIDERLLRPAQPANVVPIRPDPNADARAAIVRALESNG